MTENFTIRVDEKGARRVSKNIQGIGVASKTSESAVKLLKRSLLGLTVGFSLVAGIQGVADFGQEMATVQAITGATKEQFGDLRREARKLGAETRFSAVQAAQGMKFLSRAGFDTAQTLTAIPEVLQLAQAGALDLGRAADIASNVLKGFKLEAEETARVVDVLAKVSNSANTDIEQMGQALSFAAPIAAGLGVSIEETAAAIGALSDAGVQATRAGTGLNRIMAELETPSTKTLELFDALGISQSEVEISTVGLTGALERLVQAAVDTGGGLELFGQRGGPAFAILSEGIGDVDRLHESLKRATGTASEMAAIMDDTLTGATLKVLSAIKEVTLEFSDLVFGGAVQSGLEHIATALLAIADNLDTILKIMLVLSPLLLFTFGGAILAAIKGLAVAIGVGLVSALETLYLTILINPWGAILTALALVVTSLVVFRNEIKIFGDENVTLGHLMQAIWETISAGIGLAKDAVAGLFETLVGDGDTALTSSMSLFERWALSAAQGADIVSSMFTNMWNLIKTIAKGIPGVMFEAWEKLVNGTIEFFGGDAGPSIWEGQAEAFAKDMKDLIDAGFTWNDDTEFLVKQLFTRAREIAAEEEPIVAGAGLGSPTLPGLDPDPENESAIASTKLRKQFAELQGSLLPVIAAERELAATQEILNAAQAAGLISPKEMNRLYAIAKKNLEEVLDPMGMLTESMDEQTNLLSFFNEEHDTERQLLEITNQLKANQIFLDEKDIEMLRLRIAGMIEMNKQHQFESQVLREVNGPLEDYNRNIAILTKLKDEGSITSAKFVEIQRQEQLVLLRTQNTLKSGATQAFLEYEATVSDVAGSMKNAFANAFQGMEDALVEFTQTGKLSFTDMVNSIIQDLIRMAIQQTITAPLFGSLGKSLGLTGFAQGGVVSSPTLFPMGSGGVGLMGEAGAEAIMPLGRTSSGDLGVQVVGKSGGNTYVTNIKVEVESSGENAEEDGRVIGEAVRTAVDSRFHELNKKANSPGGINNRMDQF